MIALWLSLAWADGPRLMQARAPRWPEGAPTGVDQVACEAWVRVSGEGLPLDVETVGCPDPFADEAVAVILDSWRWYPPRLQGQNGTLEIREVVVFQRNTQAAAQVVPDNVPYADIAVGFGALHAPDDPARLKPADTAGMMRILWTASLGRVAVMGVDLDVRGIRTYAARGALQVGVGTGGTAGRAALVTGIGWIQRGADSDTTQTAFVVPSQAQASVAVAKWMSVGARGGADVFLGGVRVPGRIDPVAPVGVVHLTVGRRFYRRVEGVRLEAGWRRELGADTWTAVVGFGT